MSQENIEVVRRGFELWQEGRIDEWIKTLDADIEWTSLPIARPTSLTPATAATRWSATWALTSAGGTTTRPRSRS